MAMIGVGLAGLAFELSDGDDGVHDDRGVERRRSLPGCGACVPAGFTPELDDEVTEAVHDLRVTVEARGV